MTESPWTGDSGQANAGAELVFFLFDVPSILFTSEIVTAFEVEGRHGGVAVDESG